MITLNVMRNTLCDMLQHPLEVICCHVTVTWSPPVRSLQVGIPKLREVKTMHWLDLALWNSHTMSTKKTGQIYLGYNLHHFTDIVEQLASRNQDHATPGYVQSIRDIWFWHESRLEWLSVSVSQSQSVYWIKSIVILVVGHCFLLNHCLLIVKVFCRTHPLNW